MSFPHEQILVISVEAVTWPDASLGCPQPRVVYTQGTVVGYQVRLKSDEKVYLYHTDKKQITLCAVDDEFVFPVLSGEIQDGKPWMPVEPLESNQMPNGYTP